MKNVAKTVTFKSKENNFELFKIKNKSRFIINKHLNIILRPSDMAKLEVAKTVFFHGIRLRSTLCAQARNFGEKTGRDMEI